VRCADLACPSRSFSEWATNQRRTAGLCLKQRHDLRWAVSLWRRRYGPLDVAPHRPGGAIPPTGSMGRGAHRVNSLIVLWDAFRL
jgi:hypothetical protein